MENNTEIVRVVGEMDTPLLKALARTLFRHPSRLMDALLCTIACELAQRRGWHGGEPEFILPALEPWECAVGASECLAVSKYCDAETGFLFTTLATALVERAESQQGNAQPVN